MRSRSYTAAFSRHRLVKGIVDEPVTADEVGYPTITSGAIDGFVTVDNGNRLTVTAGAITGTDGVSETAILNQLGGAPGVDWGFTGTS